MLARDYLPLKDASYDTVRHGIVTCFYGISLKRPEGWKPSQGNGKFVSILVGYGPTGTPESICSEGGVQELIPDTSAYDEFVAKLREDYARILPKIGLNLHASQQWIKALDNVLETIVAVDVKENQLVHDLGQRGFAVVHDLEWTWTSCREHESLEHGNQSGWFPNEEDARAHALSLR